MSLRRAGGTPGVWVVAESLAVLCEMRYPHTMTDSTQVRSEEIRRRLRPLLNAVEVAGEHVTILRYDKPAAVLVPVDWYERAKACLAFSDEDGQ